VTDPKLSPPNCVCVFCKLPLEKAPNRSMINPVAGPRILDGWMQATVEIMEFKIAIGLLPAENEARSVIGISVKQALLIATLTLYSHSKWQRGYSAAWHPQPAPRNSGPDTERGRIFGRQEDASCPSSDSASQPW
jgi:hypothetical protein